MPNQDGPAVRGAGTNGERARRERRLPVYTRVVDVARIAPSLVRVVVEGTELGDPARFGDPVHADSYVKVLFLNPDGRYSEPIDPARIREDMPREYWPRMRTYTVRAFDRSAGALTLDVVTHGDAGLAGPWAAHAGVGDRVLLLGPGGDYTPDPSADWHLLAGDESALPAIAVALERLAVAAVASPVRVLIEVHDAADELALTLPPGADVHWLHRGSARPGEALAAAVTSWTVPNGTGQVFVHGEAAAVRTARRYLRLEVGLPLERLSISGYWRAGVDDEAWREVKREWNREVDESERMAGIA